MPQHHTARLFDPRNALAQIEKATGQDCRRCFRVAGIAVALEREPILADIPFAPALAAFAVTGGRRPAVLYRHRFDWPHLAGMDWGRELYRRPPWIVSQRNGVWLYRCVAAGARQCHRLAVFNNAHTRGMFFGKPTERTRLRTGPWPSLSLMPTDQVWLARLVADRHALLLHAAAAIVNGRGYVFPGHAGAGKSTMARLLRSCPDLRHVEILCDDRIVVRRHKKSWTVYGTWCHGTVADVSPASAPLSAILFPEQANRNEIAPLSLPNDAHLRLLATLVRPLATADWWEKELDILRQLLAETPCHRLRFDLTGRLGLVWEQLAGETE